MTDEDIIDDILRREGGFTVDRGGRTNFGVTQRAWSDYRARKKGTVLPEDVKQLTPELARQFYREQFVAPLTWIEDDKLRALVIDCAVNHGPTRAVKWLQEAAGVEVDGHVGPVTRNVVNLVPRTVFAGVLVRRFKFYAEIVTDQLDDPDLPNLRGWINRACEFIA